MVTFLFIILFIKHFICDFIIQTDRMIQCKGIYGNYNGLEHSLCHAIGTLLVLCIALPLTNSTFSLAIFLGLLDGFIHYHVDWAKMNLSGNYTASDKQFWVWLGLDQLLHNLTYAFIILILCHIP